MKFLRLASVPLCFLALVGCADDSTTTTSTQEAHGDAQPETPSYVHGNAAPNASGSTGAVFFEQTEIKDPMRGNIAAYRMLVPKGWEVEGGLTPVAPAFYMIPSFSQVTVRAPDGRGAIFWGPIEFGYADGANLSPFTPFDGRPFFPLQPSLGDYWQRAYELSPAKGVTNLEVVSERVLPEATKHVRKMLAPLYEATRQENAQLAGIGEAKEFDVEARELVVRYDEDGRPKEATIFAAWRHDIYRYADGSIRAAMWNLDHMYCVFGPVGTNPLADPVLAAVVRSRKEVPEWQEAIQRWYIEKNQQIVAQGQAQIAAAARASANHRATQSQDVLDISFQGWKSRNAANDAGHSSAITGIHERTTYAEPGGTTIDLPSHYNNVYTDGLGGYVLHNDANYEINTDPAFNGREWQRIEAQR